MLAALGRRREPKPISLFTSASQKNIKTPPTLHVEASALYSLVTSLENRSPLLRFPDDCSLLAKMTGRPLEQDWPPKKDTSVPAGATQTRVLSLDLS